MRILVASEQPAERRRAVSALTLRDDVEVVEVDGERAARRALEDGPPFDVVVVDGDLSPKGGYSLIYELRELAQLAGTSSPPAIVLLGREQDRWLASWAGAEAAVLKPADPFDLERRVWELAGPSPARTL